MIYFFLSISISTTYLIWVILLGVVGVVDDVVDVFADATDVVDVVDNFHYCVLIFFPIQQRMKGLPYLNYHREQKGFHVVSF